MRQTNNLRFSCRAGVVDSLKDELYRNAFLHASTRVVRENDMQW